MTCKFIVCLNFVWCFNVCRTILPEDVSQCPSESSVQHSIHQHSSDSDWSRVSSLNSLEWDVQNFFLVSPPASEFDPDTQLLLSEIERLTTQTLQETGQDLFSWFRTTKARKYCLLNTVTLNIYLICVTELL